MKRSEPTLFPTEEPNLKKARKKRSKKNLTVPVPDEPMTPKPKQVIGEVQEGNTKDQSRITTQDSCSGQKNLGSDNTEKQTMAPLQEGQVVNRASVNPPITSGGLDANRESSDSSAQTSPNDATPQLGPGVHEKIPHHVYHMQKSFSRHDMLRAAVPAKLKWYKDHPEVEKETPATLFGGAFHCKLLEPEVFESRYTIGMWEEYRSTAAKAWRDEQFKKGLKVISPENYAKICEMVQSCREHPYFHSIFARKNMKRELTVVARDPATGLLLRARYDVLPGGNVIPDIKSTINASPEEFGKQVWDMEYGAQASHYLHVYNLAFPNKKRKEFIFFAVEKEPPYLPAVYVTPYPLIEYWDRILRARRYLIAECLKTGKWPGYPVETLNESHFELPRWAVGDIERSIQNG